MGVSFHAGKALPSVDDDFKLIEDAIAKGPATDAIVRLRHVLDEELGDVSEPRWDYDAGGPDCHISYSAFGRWREALAATEGIELDKMYGFGPSNDHEAFRRMNPDTPIGSVSHDQIKGAKEKYYAHVVIQWDRVDCKLEPLLNHSDCDDELTPEQCKAILAPLREAAAKAEIFPEFSEQFIELVEYCADNDAHLVFA